MSARKAVRLWGYANKWNGPRAMVAKLERYIENDRTAYCNREPHRGAFQSLPKKDRQDGGEQRGEKADGAEERHGLHEFGQLRAEKIVDGGSHAEIESLKIPFKNFLRDPREKD
jgi:hypothetical protein